jgi:hypothetical protein
MQAKRDDSEDNVFAAVFDSKKIQHWSVYCEVLASRRLAQTVVDENEPKNEANETNEQKRGLSPDFSYTRGVFWKFVNPPHMTLARVRETKNSRTVFCQAADVRHLQ